MAGSDLAFATTIKQTKSLFEGKETQENWLWSNHQNNFLADSDL